MIVTVVDALMGSGKTTWAIDYMKQHQDQNFMYITPYLEETERIINSTKPERKFREPRRTSATDGKLENINELIRNGWDIASTHELFKRFNEDTKYQLLSSPIDYTLIIDETLDLVMPIQIKPTDIKLCIDKGLISVDKEGVCKWAYDTSEYDGRFADIKQIAQTNCMICVNNTFFIWRLDPEVFTGNYFSNIILLTYLFDGSIMKPYFEYFNIRYQKKSVKDGIFCEYYEPDIAKVASLINLYDGPLNNKIEQKSSSLSATWYKAKENAGSIKILKNNMTNYFRHIVNAKVEETIWSTFLEEGSTEENPKTLFGKNKYAAQFVSCNIRGTNKYRARSKLVYAINMFPNPGIQHYFAKKNLHINSNLYALQSMLQWIWRSCIRDGKPIDIFIPSNRMRELFIHWMRNEPIPDRK